MNLEGKAKILIGVLAALFAGVVAWAVLTAEEVPVPEERVEPPRFMEHEGTVIVEEKLGVKIWELSAEKVIVDTLTGDAALETISGTFYREDGKFLTLVAKQGIYNQPTSDVHLEGDVEVVDSDGGKLTSQKLDWFNEEGKLVATEDVVVSKDNENMRATGDVVEASEGFTHYIIKGNAKISKDDMRAFADEAEAKDDFKRFSLRGNARVLRGVKDDEYTIEADSNKSGDDL